MTDKVIYKCPCCDYCTHFPKALEAHQRFRKHFAVVKKAEEPKKEVAENVQKPVENVQKPVKNVEKVEKTVKKGGKEVKK